MVMYCGMPGALVRTLNFHVWNRSHEISIKCIRNRGEKNSKPNEWSNDRLNFHTDCHVTQNYELKKKNNNNTILCKTKITRIVWVLRRTCMILISILNSKYWANSIKPGGRLNEQNKKPNSMIRILSGWARNAQYCEWYSTKQMQKKTNFNKIMEWKSDKINRSDNDFC